MSPRPVRMIADAPVTIGDLRVAVLLAKISSPITLETPQISDEERATFEAEAAEQGVTLYWFKQGVRIWAPKPKEQEAA